MRRPKKYQSGEAAQYITRTKALKRLQLSLNDFRRLCIIKGVYPREPKHRKRAQKGASDIKILYHAKDIKFLLHEPIVWTLRDYKIFAKKTNRDRAIRDFQNLNRRLENFPDLKLDHIVKERYPTFMDAIKDLDDCLTLLFLFSTFPSLRLIPREQSFLCRRLTIEFLHAVVAAKALRKVFISIKGYYFQADIKGQKVTWIMPHYYPFQPQAKKEVDYKVMSIFVEFYTIMLGFVNYRLYHSLNLAYPPQFPGGLMQDSEESVSNEHTFVSDRVATLNYELMRTDSAAQEEENDDIDLDLLEQDGNSEKIKKLKDDAKDVAKLKKLFNGLKIFINREVPREPLVIIIRSLGGKVSWDKNIFPGATFDEGDESITHQIVDRPKMDKQYISRDYVQPQWVFDCVNRRELLPTNKYFIGAVLPPHLSPFVDPERETYVPPEEKALHDPSLIETNEDVEEDEDVSDHELESEAVRDMQLQNAFNKEMTEENVAEDKNVEENEPEEEDATADPKEKKRKEETKKMAVQPSKVIKEGKRVKHKQEVEEHRLKARMVKPRHRNLFRKLIRDQQSKEKENWLLKKKRRRIEETTKQAKKQKKIEERKKLLAE